MKKIFIFSAGAIILSAVATGAFFLFNSSAPVKQEVIEAPAGLTDEQLKEEIGQMIMIGFRGTEAGENSEIYKVIKDIKIGGVVLFDYDVPSNSFPRNIENPEQTRKLIYDLQEYSGTPLFVSVDAEGGNVNRLKSKYGFLPIVSEQKMGQDKTLATVEKESQKLSKELEELGINMNLAPVVDLNINPKNPVIGAVERSFSSDSETVFNNVKIFIKNHLNKNIIPVEKHFPGQGSATNDTHLGIADITNTYKQEELLPYQKLNDQNLLDAVMVAHVVNKNIDSEYPATLSPKFLQDILRNKIGFKGVIISDDMQMSAISANYKFDQALILAINAGCDIVSVVNNTPQGYDKDIALKTRDIIFNAVKEGKISETKITDSYNRIMNLKTKFRVIRVSGEEIKKENFELLQLSEKFNFGDIYDIAKNVEKTTGTRTALLLAVLNEELTLEKTDLCYVTDLKTGEGIRVSDNKKMVKTMKPDRDMQDFLKITKELGRDPAKTLVTCPMSFGWGGAMGPADFIPSTWARYEVKVEKITGNPADPWNVRDAILAMGLYLADSGAKLKTSKGEWASAMIYFSSSPDSGYNFYGDQVMAIAEKYQKDINIIENIQ